MDSQEPLVNSQSGNEYDRGEWEAQTVFFWLFLAGAVSGLVYVLVLLPFRFFGRISDKTFQRHLFTALITSVTLNDVAGVILDGVFDLDKFSLYWAGKFLVPIWLIHSAVRFLCTLQKRSRATAGTTITASEPLHSGQHEKVAASHNFLANRMPDIHKYHGAISMAVIAGVVVFWVIQDSSCSRKTRLLSPPLSIIVAVVGGFWAGFVNGTLKRYFPQSLTKSHEQARDTAPTGSERAAEKDDTELAADKDDTEPENEEDWWFLVEMMIYSGSLFGGKFLLDRLCPTLEHSI